MLVTPPFAYEGHIENTPLLRQTALPENTSRHQYACAGHFIRSQIATPCAEIGY